MAINEKVEIVILCPIRTESAIIWENILEPESKYLKEFKLSYDLGKIKSGEKSWTVALFETGKGVANMQMKASHVMLGLKPEYIFLIGIAGGIKDVEIGDVVIADKAYSYESGKETEDGFYARPNSAKPKHDFLSLVKGLAQNFERKFTSHKVLIGGIASGEKVLTDIDSPTLDRIKRVYNDTLAVEMEAIGFYRAAEERDIPALNIRGVSDLIKGKAATESSGSRPLAVKRAFDFFLYILPHLTSRTFSKNTLPSQKIKVRYRTAPFANWLRFSKVLNGSLSLFENKVILKGGAREVELEHIKSVERFTMPGDLKANWVKVIYRAMDQEEMLFFSTGSLPGWGSVFGGGKELYQNLSRYLEN